jgi:hypothetical protein
MNADHNFAHIDELGQRLVDLTFRALIILRHAVVALQA